MDELCEICENRNIDKFLTIKLFVGECVGNGSVYMCNDCKEKFRLNKSGKLIDERIMPELKKLIKSSLIKQMILNALEK